MVGKNPRRRMPIVPAAMACAAVTWLSKSQPFTVGRSLRKSRTSNVPMKGFMEDFQAWKGTWTPEEEADEYERVTMNLDKDYRKTDKWLTEEPKLSKEKMQEFGKIMNKFMDNELADVKRAEMRKNMKPPGLKQVVKEKVFNLRFSCVRMDRDADRRWKWYHKIRGDQGNTHVSPPSPLPEYIPFINNDTESHERCLAMCRELDKVLVDVCDMILTEPGRTFPDKAPADKDEDHIYGEERPREYWEQAKKSGQDGRFEKMVPPIGDHFELEAKHVLTSQFTELQEKYMPELRQAWKDNGMSEEDVKKNSEHVSNEVVANLIEAWGNSSHDCEKYIDLTKRAFATEKNVPGATKADVLKEIWQVMDIKDPIDEEALTELAKYPASDPEDPCFRTPWGYASTLYKSEAVDAWGTKFLLGLFETKEECKAEFDIWNAEYKKAMKEQKEELKEWSVQMQATLDADPRGLALYERAVKEAQDELA